MRSLTGVRGVAALWVYLYHVTNAGFGLGLPGLTLIPMSRFGWAGVDLFFALSGFVLMHAHGADLARLSRARLMRFFKLRIARVYPLSLAALVLVALLVAADPAFAAWFRAQAPGNLSGPAFLRTALLATRWGLPGKGDWNEPVWSLSAELVGYAAFPVLAWVLMRAKGFWAPVAVAALSLALLLTFQVAAHQTADNFYDLRSALIRMGCGLTAGAALAKAFARAPTWAARAATPLSLAALVLIAAGGVRPDLAWTAPPGFALLVFALAFQRGPVDALLASKPVHALGRISFPLYLIHSMPLMALSHWGISSHPAPATAAAALAVLVIATLAAAALLHIALERPAQAWGRKWAGPAV
ncbi:acyltransferase family protein [Phenylobacterium aquaticum]|uniref:acyltransferase family protein n=1 Tax=Phenylobacterium aquaticum TaxID=1763816 RepID=UPI001F5C2E1C|nr:acyltransferase [Phenylobacterium aquaticum]MCI3135001.1 acyltransferase [Phenylobacterium aquaticum]